MELSKAHRVISNAICIHSFCPGSKIVQIGVIYKVKT